MSNTFPVSALSRVTSLLEEVGAEKAAAAKHGSDGGTELGHSGSAAKDPGGYKGPSSHPSAKADGNVQAAPIGERFRENSADMKDKHTIANVDQISGDGGSQDSKQLNIGTQQSATGEDPKTEDNFKSTKEDPGTSHPANADEQGKKYASMDKKALTKLAYDKMNEVLADMANGFHNKKAAPAAIPANTAPTATQKKAADAANIAAQAGYDLAGAVAAQQPDLEKQAAFQEAAEGFIKQALEDADEVAIFLSNYSAERSKLTKNAEGPPPDMMGGGGPPPGDPMGGGLPGGMGGGMPGGGPDPGGMPPEMGGPGAPAPGPAPGGDMGGGGGPGGPGGGGHEQALMELANALMEAGITPDELIQAMQGGGGGMAGGAGPAPEGMGGGGGGGLPSPGGEGGEGGPEGDGGEPEPEPEGEKAGAARLTKGQRQQVIKMASAVKDMQRKGKVRIKEAKPGTKTRVERDEMKNFLNEVCRR